MVVVVMEQKVGILEPGCLLCGLLLMLYRLNVLSACKWLTLESLLGLWRERYFVWETYMLGAVVYLNPGKTVVRSCFGTEGESLF